MQVSVETLKGLERKVTISVPTKEVEEEVSLRLKDLARKVKIDGFRPGKVPLNIVQKRYSDSVREEVARDMVQPTLSEALKKEDLTPAGMPSIEPIELESGKDFKYAATFEVFPEIEVKELEQEEVEIISSDVKADDVNAMIEKLREQNKTWEEVEKACKEGNKVNIDFEGFIDDEAFEGGKAQGHEIELGSGSMIPGFEEGIVGKKPGEEFELNVTFPKDYGHEKLAGKESLFKCKLNKVFEGKLPELNAEFAKQFNIEKGGIEALKKDIKANMQRELERQVSSLNREHTFDKLLEKNKFEIPNALVDREIDNLKHEMYHRIFGKEHKANEKIPDFPRDMFEEQARRRVHLGLLFSEYVEKHEITATKERVDAMIEKLAEAYENPDELKEFYNSNKERLAEIEALVTEEMVSEKILEDAKVKSKKMKYDEVMNPNKDKKGA